MAGRCLPRVAAVSIGHPELVSIDEVPDDAYIATAAAIGAPAGTTQWQVLGVDCVNGVEMMRADIVVEASRLDQPTAMLAFNQTRLGRSRLFWRAQEIASSYPASA
jgi:hypothetical protein